MLLQSNGSGGGGGGDESKGKGVDFMHIHRKGGFLSLMKILQKYAYIFRRHDELCIKYYTLILLQIWIIWKNVYNLQNIAFILDSKYFS